MPIQLSRLHEVFPEEDLEWRIQSQGLSNGKPWAIVLCYVTNRAIMARLDEVCGPEGWQNEFRQIAPVADQGKTQDGFLCGISILVDTHSGDAPTWITKWDGANCSDVEPVKGGISDSMKRAAVQWGIGRYLYKLKEGFAHISEDKSPGARRTKINQQTYYWTPPDLPDWAKPKKPKAAFDQFVERLALMDVTEAEEIKGVARLLVGKPKIATSDYALANAASLDQLRSAVNKVKGKE